MSAERRKLLLAVIENLSRAHREWVESDLQVLSEPLWARLEETVEVFEDGDLPGDLRPLAARVDVLAREWDAYKLTAESDHQAVPNNGFWKALELVQKLAHDAKPRPKVVLETLAQLEKQNVGDLQICRIYGWVDEEGRPEYWRLAEERATPGKHLNEHFIPPNEKAAREREAREAQILKATKDRQARKLKALAATGPETLAELCQQGLSRRQMAIIKSCTPEDIERQCEELGLDIPPLDYEDLRTVRGTHEKPINEALQRQLDATQANNAKKAAPKPAAKKPAAKPADKAPEPPKRPRGRPRKETEPTSHVAPLPPDVRNEIIGYHVEGVDLADIIDTMVGRADESEIHAVIEAHESSMAEA